MSLPYGFPSGQPDTAWSQRPLVERFVSDDAMIKTLGPVGFRRSWKAGDTVIRYGQRTDRVSLCLNGQYKILLNGVDGQPHFMRRIGAGEMFGVPSALAGTPFPTDVVCEEPGETLEIPQQALIARLRTEPELALAIIKSLATRVAEMFDVMEADLLPSLRSRVYQRLLRLAHFNGQPDRFGHITLLLTQQEIAQSVNASRPKVHHELKRLEQEGVIRLGYRRITMLQKPDT